MPLPEELKRRLDFEDEPLKKRLKLAENVLLYPLFPISNKGDIVIEWFCKNFTNCDNSESLHQLIISLKQCVKLLDFKTCSYGTESKLMTAIFKYMQNRDVKLENNPKEVHLNKTFFELCLDLIENSSINNYFQQSVDQYFNLTCQTLQSLLIYSKYNDIKTEEKKAGKTNECVYKQFLKRLINDLFNFIKKFNKKALLISPFLDSQLFWVILDLTSVDDYSSIAFNICQTIVFPANHSALYRKYIVALIQGKSLSELIEECGESLRPIVTAMDILLKNNISTNYNDRRFVNFVELFVHSYKFDQYLLYLFNILLYKCLGLRQDFIAVSDDISVLDVKRDFAKKIHLQIMTFYTKYNVKLDAKYTLDSENTIQFIYFLQKITIDLLLDGSMSMLSLSLIEQSFTLDPDILEPIIENILPDIMIQKKLCKDDDLDILNEYDNIMVTILENLFKMSRGPEYIGRLLDAFKNKIERNEALICENITSDDVFPANFCNAFGKLSSELVSWQHINLFKQLIDYFNEFCIEKLNSEPQNRSIILLVECVCSLISSFFYQSKMGDQNIPEAVQNKFNTMFEAFGSESLMKLCNTCLNHTNENRLTRSFLKLCQNYGHLKLILWQYQPYYAVDNVDDHIEKLKTSPFHISNITILHSYINCGKWKKIFKSISKINDPACTNLKISLILQNNIAIKIYNIEKHCDELSIIDENIREYLIQHFDEIWEFIFKNDIYIDVTLSELNVSELKSISKTIVDKMLENGNTNDVIDIIKRTKTNRELISGIIMESLRRLWIYFDKKKVLKSYPSIYESSDHNDFNIKEFFQNVSNTQDYVNKLIECNLLKNEETSSTMHKLMQLINILPVEFMKENMQNCVIFTSVVIYMMIDQSSKKNVLETIIKTILMRIFELSYKTPNIFEIFSSSLIFQWIENNFFKFFAVLNDDDINMCELFKQLIIGAITKDSVEEVKNVYEYIAAGCQIDKDNTSDIFVNRTFQSLSFVLFALANVKKSNMSSETKTVINKTKEDALRLFDCYLKKVNWESFDGEKSEKNENGMEIDQAHDITLNAENSVPIKNIIESVTYMLDSYKTSDKNRFEENANLLKFFTNFTLNILTDPDMILPHARASCSFINMVLKSRSLSSSNNKDEFLSNVWTKSRQCLKICNNKVGTGWKEVTSTILENVTLLCELCNIKFCNFYLTKELIQFNNDTIEHTDAAETKVVQQLWYCFLNANLTIAGKNEARSTIVKQMTKYFFFWLRNIMNQSSWKTNVDINYDDFFNGEFDNKLILTNSKKPSDLMIVKNFETIKICFEIITEFVTTKKMILSSSLIDTIIQMPSIVNFNLSTSQSKTQSFDIFCVLYEKCIVLVNALLLNRPEMLQDRWPAFLQAYRKLVYALTIKSDSDQVCTDENIAKLVKLSITIERLTETMVHNVKQDISRIVAYIIADSINYFQRVSIYPLVKFHLQNNITCLIRLLDNHAVGFLMRNMSGASRIIFQQFYDNYKKYYKFTGMS